MHVYTMCVRKGPVRYQPTPRTSLLLHLYRTSFECCRASCQDGRCSPERFTFQPCPPSKMEEEADEIERLLRTMAVPGVGEGGEGVGRERAGRGGGRLGLGEEVGVTGMDYMEFTLMGLEEGENSSGGA